MHLLSRGFKALNRVYQENCLFSKNINLWLGTRIFILSLNFFFTPEKSCENDILENNHKDTLQILRQLFLMSKEIRLGPSQSFLYFPLPQSYLFETHDRHRRKLQILKHKYILKVIHNTQGRQTWQCT